MIRIALNGFGRIGRNFLRTLIIDPQSEQKIKIVALNIGPAQPEDLPYWIQYDTLMGPFFGDVSYKNNVLKINDHEIKIFTELDPTKLPWKDLRIDWVIDATGHFTKRAGAEKHISAGAKKVIITAPAQDEDCSIVMGVNEEVYKKEDKIISLGSCTTNALAPTLAVIHKHFGIRHASLTTIHAYTNSQVLLDVNDTKIRLTRAAAVNMIPSTTGATKVIGKIIPELKGKLIGNAVRIPLDKVSLIDLVITLEKNATAEEINEKFAEANKNELTRILDITHEPLVSSDFKGNPHSVVIDGLLTTCQNNIAKIFGWYDNEWAYSLRIKDFLVKFGE
ncbi:TPA: type I glyceraldehyde-3-phosphate dehydrogenase [Candidatus Dependentiae bacterium]|nr:MAG: Glyceraldehyde-3-phosphate dehydrogenase, type I [candidate division TM6 bacterium GW2011_GWF2_36_131]KKQ03052.1 MAG: Glyceraldehyde-3-phosphate dehydrogenase, type I [candidate division TM6 bacterium GW2011_GWE2_36_25]KKQ19619.1 MAG: Glyceraldehyde-3-phosphate dehydrogenase, type I [candidate division TM6 bacterium GW2011_GWA2_36_9]HBR71134.1 type I glyceraldehyde-3-phosphate dehydrogenase [Candidatus Dependentiae bacterium]HCU00489.1 type I glyceraldehyde-3-phosphate dehydrogenase [Ca